MSITKIINVEISSLSKKRGESYVNIGTRTFITCSHIPNIKIDDIIVCKTNDGKTRYFECDSIEENVDVFHEIGYFCRLLYRKSLEEAKNLLNGCEFSLATGDQIKTAREESCWC